MWRFDFLGATRKFQIGALPFIFTNNCLQRRLMSQDVNNEEGHALENFESPMRQIGEGTYGIVFKARSKRDSQHYALKQIRLNQ